jgi:hypothetical protein
MMLVLRNPDEVKNDTERFASSIKDDWNVAIVEVRGTGETGWAADLQWHIRRAAAWTGRTIASMRVYDALRFLEFGRSLPGVRDEGIGIAAKGEMAVVALYAALLDDNCKTVLIQDPPASQNDESSPDGQGIAIEMLNCLRITDVCQIPAYLTNTNTLLTGEIPETYQWAIDTRNRLGSNAQLRVIESMSQY